MFAKKILIFLQTSITYDYLTKKKTPRKNIVSKFKTVYPILNSFLLVVVVAKMALLINTLRSDILKYHVFSF